MVDGEAEVVKHSRTIALVGSTDDHHRKVAAIVEAKVVDGRLQLFAIILQPAWKVERWTDWHGVIDALLSIDWKQEVVHSRKCETHTFWI